MTYKGLAIGLLELIKLGGLHFVAVFDQMKHRWWLPSLPMA